MGRRQARHRHSRGGAAACPDHHHGHGRQRDAFERHARRCDQGGDEGQGHGLRRRDREQGIPSRPAEVPRGEDRWPVLRGADPRRAQRHLREPRERAQAHVAPRLHHRRATGRDAQARRQRAGPGSRIAEVHGARVGVDRGLRRTAPGGCVRPRRSRRPRAARRPARPARVRPRLVVDERRPAPPARPAPRRAEADACQEGEEGAPPVSRRRSSR